MYSATFVTIEIFYAFAWQIIFPFNYHITWSYLWDLLLSLLWIKWMLSLMTFHIFISYPRLIIDHLFMMLLQINRICKNNILYMYPKLVQHLEWILYLINHHPISLSIITVLTWHLLYLSTICWLLTSPLVPIITISFTVPPSLRMVLIQ